jgi:hypothetical protein
MISQKYTQEEVNNLNEIHGVLSRDSRYVHIEPRSSKVLQFILQRKIEKVEKTYNDQIRFTVIESDRVGSGKETLYVPTPVNG